MIDKEFIYYDFGKYENLVSHFTSSTFFWGFPSLVDLGCFLIVSEHKSEKPQAESCSDGTIAKVNPNLCFVLKFLPKWISALHLVLYVLQKKVLSDTLKPVETICKGKLNEFCCLIG